MTQAIPLLRGVAIATLNQLAGHFVLEYHPVGHPIQEKSR